VDEKQRSILLTEDGYEAAEDVLQARRPPMRAPRSDPARRPARRRGGAGSRARAHVLRPCATAAWLRGCRAALCARARAPAVAAQSRQGPVWSASGRRCRA